MLLEESTQDKVKHKLFLDVFVNDLNFRDVNLGDLRHENWYTLGSRKAS